MPVLLRFDAVGLRGLNLSGYVHVAGGDEAAGTARFRLFGDFLAVLRFQ